MRRASNRHIEKTAERMRGRSLIRHIEKDAERTVRRSLIRHIAKDAERMVLPAPIRHITHEAQQVDRALYAAVARTSTPRLDAAMRVLSRAADHSKLSIAAAGTLALAGGERGRRAAGLGLASVAATSAACNLVAKPLIRRRRPPQRALSVVARRRVPMPRSRSFPSAHTAAAVAFASGTGRVMPAVSPPLHGLATLVAYSRVHTGVHYPADVVSGAVLGAIVADLVAPLSAALGARMAIEQRAGGD